MLGKDRGPGTMCWVPAHYAILVQRTHGACFCSVVRAQVLVLDHAWVKPETLADGWHIKAYVKVDALLCWTLRDHAWPRKVSLKP